VSDLYTPENLGYTYGLGLPFVYAAKNLVLIENEFVRLIKYLKNPGGPVEGLKVFELTRAQIKPPVPKSHLALPVAVDAALVAKVRARGPRLPATGNGLREQEEAAAGGAHAFAFISDVDATSPQNAEFRVFLNADNPTPDTPVSDPHYVGSFAIFTHGMKMGAGGMTPSFMIDLTDAVARVGGTASKLNVQIVSVPNRKGADAGIVNIGRIQVAFLAP
jgi:tyrosinase